MKLVAAQGNIRKAHNKRAVKEIIARQTKKNVQAKGIPYNTALWCVRQKKQIERKQNEVNYWLHRRVIHIYLAKRNNQRSTRKYDTATRRRGPADGKKQRGYHKGGGWGGSVTKLQGVYVPCRKNVNEAMTLSIDGTEQSTWRSLVVTGDYHPSPQLSQKCSRRTLSRCVYSSTLVHKQSYKAVHITVIRPSGSPCRV